MTLSRYEIILFDFPNKYQFLRILFNNLSFPEPNHLKLIRKVRDHQRQNKMDFALFRILLVILILFIYLFLSLTTIYKFEFNYYSCMDPVLYPSIEKWLICDWSIFSQMYWHFYQMFLTTIHRSSFSYYTFYGSRVPVYFSFGQNGHVRYCHQISSFVVCSRCHLKAFTV